MILARSRSRLGTLGITYNTKAIKEAPKSWQDILDPRFKGPNLGLVFPQEMLVIPSPVAIMKNTKNLAAAKKFVDFLLSKEGQVIIASSGTLPIRRDVEVSRGLGLAPPEEAVKRAMKVDYLQMIKEKEALIQKFSEIMRAN